MKISILGISIDNVTLGEALIRIRDFLHDFSQHYIVTTNPEFIMAARHDDEFRNIINRADLSVADGTGIAFAAARSGHRLRQRITGIDLLWEIARIAKQQGASLFLLGARHGIAEKAAQKIAEQIPGVSIVGTECGYRHWHRRMKDEKLIDIVNRRKPDILFVAFGHVKQEKWIYHNLPKLPSVKIAMGVGGSFDYISGHVRRAPHWMRAIGLEWLFRVMRQPWRLPRIITAVVVFSWNVLIKKSHGT
ncbi:MAG: WecB/TagA/CpsF family glycosyltransferase [Patescibacteria group bacterium]|nr:WecB/TagA/CpsF family glycosyltransferase [Patescibacteria group bacterium]